MTTVYDVARVAGVSTATVSRVMRGSELVHPDTRQRVLAVVEALSFVPDATARGLSRGRKDVIGFVGLERGTHEIDIERTSLLFVDQIVHATEAVLRHTDYSLLLAFGPRGQQFEQRIRSLTGKVDGLLIAEEAIPAEELRALAGRIPVVLIAGRPDETELDVVAADNVGGLAALVSHLVGHHRYRRLCFVTGPKDAPDASQRQTAFEAAVLASRDCVIDQVIHGDFSEASGTAAARVLLDRTVLPQAVVCANDQMAIGDVYPSRLVEPALTTVSQPLRDLGVRAAQRLLARIAQRDLPPRAEVLPTEAVIRASCGCGRPGADQ
jgi:LacI family transcriptional regulator